MDISKSRSRRQGVPLNCKPLNCICLFQLKTVTSTHRNQMKKQKMFHQNWLNPPRKRERNCSRNLLRWQLSCLRQNRYSVLYSSWGTFSSLKTLRRSIRGLIGKFGVSYSHPATNFRRGSRVLARFRAFLFRSQELVKKQVKCFLLALNCLSLLFVFGEFRMYMAFSPEICVKSVWRLCLNIICHYGRLSTRRDMSCWTYRLFMHLNVFWSSNTFRDVVRWKQSKIPQEPSLPDSCVRELSNIINNKIVNIWGSTDQGSSGVVSFCVLSFLTEL